MDRCEADGIVQLIDEGMSINRMEQGRETLMQRTGFAGTLAEYIQQQIEEVRQTVGAGRVLLALSGGVDSSVCGALVHKAIGGQLVSVFVDHGLMRKGEPESVRKIFGDMLHMNLVAVDATDRFLDKLAGVGEPERKRKIIGEEFIRVFEEEAEKIGDVRFLAQGTIYPDIIESKSGKGGIKSHHNVGGLPDDFDFELIEPLKYLFKDEVREAGELLGLPHEQVYRQPFPGPGLGVRVIGAVTREKIHMVRESDAILREEVKNAGLEGAIWQYFTACPGFLTVGVKDGRRVYGQAIAIRAVTSVDAMSADVFPMPHDVLQRISSRITQEVEGVNRVVYDITPKPPGTIEWE